MQNYTDCNSLPYQILFYFFREFEFPAHVQNVNNIMYFFNLKYIYFDYYKCCGISFDCIWIFLFNNLIWTNPTSTLIYVGLFSPFHLSPLFVPAQCAKQLLRLRMAFRFECDYDSCEGTMWFWSNAISKNCEWRCDLIAMRWPIFLNDNTIMMRSECKITKKDNFSNYQKKF